jgi:two-component system OmpR family response regulator
MKILVIEDEQQLAQILREGFEHHQFAVDTVNDGNVGLGRALSNAYDLIILDIMLPGIDGFEVCKRLREAKKSTPVLMLTAREMTEDRVAGLDLGADDYMVKPFDFAELLARARALLRRPSSLLPAVLKFGPLELDGKAYEVRKNGQPLRLTKTEFSILELLMRHPHQALSREQILQHIRPDEYSANSNLVDVYVNYLRKKIGDRKKNTIQTVSGVGYKLTKPKNSLA